ncbi:MAG: hypothetical protein RIT15_371, partial [Pseudomonadota bacterium]
MINTIQTPASTSRRGFLKASGAASTLASSGFMLGVALPEGAAAAAMIHTPNAWVHIADDNTITLLSARSEMGQGVYTSMPMLIAEELNVDIGQIKVAIAPPGAAYTNELLGAQITGGSTSVRDGWEKLRVAGAQVREMLRAAAAARWGVDLDKVKADKGLLTAPNGKRATYGEMAEAASRMSVPEKPPIKDPKDFKIVGKATKRLDTPVKTNGTAQFGIDVTLPGMVYASLEQCPVIDGKVKSFDGAAAKAMPGVVDVVQVNDGVAVVATSYWQAVQARKVLKVQWDEGDVAALSDKSMAAATRKALTDGKALPIGKPLGDVAKALAGAAKVVKAEYYTPMEAHAPLEPMNFTADFKNGKCLLIGGTQFQQGAVGATAAVLGIQPEDISVQT